MVLDILKKYLPNYPNKYPKGFQKILESFPSEYKLNDKDVEFIWKAYQFGDNAHKGQKRKYKFMGHKHTHQDHLGSL